MYLHNKYTRWYFGIINNAQNRTIIGYSEKHHIIPKSLGGCNKRNNLVSLTAREHFICHWLLTKMTTGKDKNKMCMALIMMEKNHKKHFRYNSPLTSRVYASVKAQAIEGFRESAKKLVQQGKHNFQKIDRHGQNHPSFDHTVYIWYHIPSKTKISMTRYDLIKTYKLGNGDVCQILKGIRKSTKGWILWEKRPIEYTWFHIETITVVVMTKSDFIKKYSISRSIVEDMINKNHSSKGWALQIG
jgi:hypothetical protein